MTPKDDVLTIRRYDLKTPIAVTYAPKATGADPKKGDAMSLTRKCEACGQPITAKHFMNLEISVYETEGPEIQDPQGQSVGDYCDRCVRAGAALSHVLSGLKRGANG